MNIGFIVTVWESVTRLCMSVCPAVTAYISTTVGRILMKLSGTVGTWIRLVFVNFRKIWLSDYIIVM